MAMITATNRSCLNPIPGPCRGSRDERGEWWLEDARGAKSMVESGMVDTVGPLTRRVNGCRKSRNSRYLYRVVVDTGAALRILHLRESRCAGRRAATVGRRFRRVPGA